MNITVKTYAKQNITIKDYVGDLNCKPGNSGTVNISSSEGVLNLSSQKTELSLKSENNVMALIDLEDLTDKVNEYVRDEVIGTVKNEVIAAVNERTAAAIKEESDKLKPLIYAGL